MKSKINSCEKHPLYNNCIIKGMSQYIRIVTVTIKIISHVSTVKECDYRTVALASIQSFAAVCVRAVWYVGTSTGSAF